jgi:O-antigen/teichoic acid export membrane protein
MGLGLYVVGTLEVPLIAALASVEDLGVYRTAMQFINVINPFLPLFFHHLYPQLVELERDNPLAVLGAQFRALGRVAAFGVPLTAAAFVLAPWVYPLVFGEKFAAAAYPFATLFAAKVLSVGVNVFMWGALARKLDRAAVLLTLSVSVVSILLNVMLIPVLGIIGAAVVNCLAQSLLLAGYVALMARSTSKLRLKFVP